MLVLITSVLAPGASRALAAWAGTSSPWDEICTTLGIKQAASPASGLATELPGDTNDARVQGDCPFCLPSGSPAALPSQPAGVPPAVERDTTRFLFFFISAPRLHLVPDDARPRAPPQFA